MNDSEIAFLCSEIGRGHPFYLDGLYEAMAAEGAAQRVRRSSVFEVSEGLARRAWQAVRAAYVIAGRGGATTHLYHRIRGDRRYDDDSWTVRMLGRDVRRWVERGASVVVDHPVLVGAIRPHPEVWYFHGEMVAPPESVVRSARRVFVPLEDTAREFVARGMDPARLRVTGICIEAGLASAAAAAFDARQRRLEAGSPLTVACFSSGAEPAAHVRAIAAAAASLAGRGHRPLVFAARGGRLARAAASAGIESHVIPFHGRAELDRLTAHHFPTFDLVVSPPHERSNWAVALGLPFLLVGPDIGPFAPLNRARLLRTGVAEELSAAGAPSAGSLVESLRRSGRLLAAVQRGWGLPIQGFRRAAEMLLEEAGSV